MTKQSTDNFDFGTLVAILFGIAVAIIALPFLIVGALIMNTSRGGGSGHPRNDEITQAEIDARAAFEEGSLLHQHYEMNGTIVQGLKDPEW